MNELLISNHIEKEEVLSSKISVGILTMLKHKRLLTVLQLLLSVPKALQQGFLDLARTIPIEEY